MALRPKTLWIAVVPVFVGTSLAVAETGRVNPLIAFLALIASILLQILTNLQNDVGYTKRGAETGSRIGLPRATARGWLTRWDVRSYTAIVFVISAPYALSLQNVMRSLTPDGMYFHPWSSQTMMQTVSLKFLREAPVRTLLSIHIQPPAFDAIRALLALPLRDLSDEAAVMRVDSALYSFGAVLVAMLVALVFRWLSEYGLAAGAVGGLVMLLHPASMFFATFLDSTLLSSRLVAGTYFSLWKLKNGRDTSITSFSLLVLGLFFTRSIFQWPALLMFAFCLHLLGVGQRTLKTFLVATCLISGLYLAKQAFQFGLSSTTSFSGISLANSIGAGLGTKTYTTYLDRGEHSTKEDPSLPGVLTSKTKINGEPNFNNIAYLELNRQLLARYEDTLRNTSFERLAGSYLENTLIYFMPTSKYSRPDLRKAEADLRAANVDIGTARAARFPSVTLTGEGGTVNSALSGLFGAGTFFYTLTSSLSAPLFAGGKLEGQEELNRARFAELIETYQQAVLAAFQDVENALTAVDQNGQQYGFTREAYRLADVRFRVGTIDFLSVLEAQRTVFQAGRFRGAGRCGALCRARRRLPRAGRRLGKTKPRVKAASFRCARTAWCMCPATPRIAR